jgi:L-fucose isomerase-like protein
MLDYTLKIGLASCRRWLPGKRTGIFNPDYARANKKQVEDFVRTHYSDAQTSFTDLSFLNDEGMMFDVRQAEPIAEEFKKQKVDALFIINCNFGCEEVAARLARLLQIPTLIWAPQDTIFEADGTRYTDAQCGLFAMSKQLTRYHVPFEHIENCLVESPVFAKGFGQFLSVACMVKNFRTLRVAQVGMRPRPFASVIFNEGELVEKFGIDVVPVNMVAVTEIFEAVMKEKPADLAADVQLLKDQYQDMGGLDDESLVRMAAFKETFRRIMQETGCQVICTECWTCMLQTVNAMPCIAMSMLADEKLIVTCESDVCGAITMALLSCAARGKDIPFFGEFTVRHPENPNAELLWHCGPFGWSLKKPESPARIFNMKPSFQVKDGVYTIARLDSAEGNYSLLDGRFKAVDGPYTFGTYIWAEFDDYSKWEKKLIYGPYIHHMAEIAGDYTDVLEAFCRHVPGLTVDRP